MVLGEDEWKHPLFATQCSKPETTKRTTGNRRARILPAESRAAIPRTTAMQTSALAGIALRKITPHPCAVSLLSV